MDSVQLAGILRQNIHTRRIFRGVCARDQLRKVCVPRGRPSAYIVNTHPIRLPGLHWVCCYFTGQGNSFYFDSFGLPPTHHQVTQFLRRHSKKVVYNQRLLQDITSSVCGLYVMYFIYQMSRGMSMQRMLQPFSINTLRNDRIVQRRIQTLFT